MKNAPMTGSSSATVPILKTLENTGPRTAATSWWHKSLRYKEGESDFGDPLARPVLDHLSVTAFAGVMVSGMAGEEQGNMENSNEDKFSLQEPRSTLEATSHIQARFRCLG